MSQKNYSACISRFSEVPVSVWEQYLNWNIKEPLISSWAKLDPIRDFHSTTFFSVKRCLFLHLVLQLFSLCSSFLWRKEKCQKAKVNLVLCGLAQHFWLCTTGSRHAFTAECTGWGPSPAALQTDLANSMLVSTLWLTGRASSCHDFAANLNILHFKRMGHTQGWKPHSNTAKTYCSWWRVWHFLEVFNYLLSWLTSSKKKKNPAGW